MSPSPSPIIPFLPLMIPATLSGIAKWLGIGVALGGAVGAGVSLGFGARDIAERQIRQQQTEIYNDVWRNWREQVMEYRRQEIRYAAEQIAHYIQTNIISSAMSGLQTSLKLKMEEFHSATRAQLNTTMTTEVGKVSSQVQSATQAITGAISSEHITTRDLINTIPGQIETQAGATRDLIDRRATAIAGTLDRIGTQVDGIADFSTLLGAALSTGVFSMSGVTGLIDTLASKLGYQAHTVRAKCIPGTGKELLKHLLVGAIPMMLPLVYKLVPPFTDFVNTIMDHAWRMHFEPLLREAPITPDKAFAVANTLFANAFISGVAAHLASQTAEASASLKFMGLPYLAAFLTDMAGFSRIAAGTLGILIAVGLNQPMRYWANEKLRPWLLRDQDFMELMSRGAFEDPATLRCPGLEEAVAAVPGATPSEKELYFVGHYGYPDGYHGFMKELSYAPLRYFPLVAIARTGEWDEDWFKEALARSGYSPTAKAKLMALLRYLSRERGLMAILTQMRRLYRQDYITEDQIRNELKGLGMTEEAIELRLRAMRYEKAFHRRRDMEQALRASFRRGRITDGDLVNMLTVLAGKLPEGAKWALMTEQVRRYGGVMFGPMEPAEVPELPMPWEWEIEE